MADVAIIQAKKFLPKGIKKCVYIGSKQEDGKIYFNDDVFFRCSHDKKIVELYYQEKQNWVITDILEITGLSNFNATQAQNMIHGGGGVAPNADVENAVLWAIEKCNSGNITYSQQTRNLKNPNGTSYDCSSFVITAFYVGGFDAAATYTGDMVSGFTALGFEWINDQHYFQSYELQRGDILLNEQTHTQMYIGNNQDANCGTTPARIEGHTTGYWDGILRYVG